MCIRDRSCPTKRQSTAMLRVLVYGFPIGTLDTRSPLPRFTFKSARDELPVLHGRGFPITEDINTSDRGRATRRPRRLRSLPALCKQSSSRCLDMRQATSSAFKSVQLGQSAESRRSPGKFHGLSAVWATRRLGRGIVCAFFAHRRDSALSS